MGLKKQGYTPKRRNSASRERKKIYIFATEGKNRTETLYFRNINKQNVRVVFTKGKATDPVGMMNVLIDTCEENDISDDMGDKAYCVFDLDNKTSKNSQIKTAEKKAKESKYNIKVITTGPCIELWFLLHFKYTTKSYNSNDDLIKDLKEYINDYEKSSDNIFEILEDKLDFAIKNAKKLERHNLEDGKKPHTVEFSPSSEVYKIFEDLNKKDN